MDLSFLQGKTINRVDWGSDYCLLEIDGKAYKIDAGMSYDDVYLSIEETTDPYELNRIGLLSDDDLKKIEDARAKEWKKQQRQEEEQEFERLKKKLKK